MKRIDIYTKVLQQNKDVILVARDARARYSTLALD